MTKSDDINEAFNKVDENLDELVDAATLFVNEQLTKAADLLREKLAQLRDVGLANLAEHERDEATADDIKRTIDDGVKQAKDFLNDFLNKGSKPVDNKTVEEKRELLRKHFSAGNMTFAEAALDGWSDEEVARQYDYLRAEGFLS